VKNVFPYIVYASAFALASSAAYYSVFGLSKLFSAQALAVVIMAGTLEVSKLITASYLHRYWKRIGLLLKTYLVTAVFVLMFITSIGIYGFLVSAYQTTADQLTVLDKQIDVIELKRDRFQTQLDEYSAEKKQLSESISELSKGLSNNVIQYLDQETGEIITTTSSSTRRVLERQLDDSKQQRNTVNLKIESLTDSITSLDLQVLDIESNNDVVAELGPLRYVAELTNQPMNQVVNWFILIFIFVFDPLAITLLIAAQIANKKSDTTEQNVKAIINANDNLSESIDNLKQSAEEDVLDDTLAAEEFEVDDIEWLKKQAEQEELYQEKKKTNRPKIIS
tara:strand:+ start:1621 stop:2631 length:1011 start_codon:yes stop_codon:yes gene_type:complete